MALFKRTFVRGDTLVGLYAILQDGAGTPVNLEGQEVYLYMQSVLDGSVKVDGKGVHVLDAVGGRVVYYWDAEDVNTLGGFWTWFVRTHEGKRSTHPVGDKLLVTFVDGPLDT